MFYFVQFDSKRLDVSIVNTDPVIFFKQFCERATAVS